MTKEDWEKVAKALSGTYGIAKLKVDGREVDFQRELVSKNTMGIVTYVDGKFKGAWFSPENDHPEQKYLRPVSKFIYSAKDRKALNKSPKWVKKERVFDPNKKHHYFDPIWPSATAIRRHYQKTFTSIELVEVIG